MYRKVKQIKTPAPLTMGGLNRRVYKIAIAYKERTKFKVTLNNAIPNLFTVLAMPEMPLHGNLV